MPPHLPIHLPTQAKALCCNTKIDKPNLIFSGDNFSTTESFNLKRKTMGFRPGRRLLWLNLSTFLLVHKKSAPTFSTRCLQTGEKDALIYHRGGSDICEKWIYLSGFKLQAVSMWASTLEGKAAHFQNSLVFHFLQNYTSHLIKQKDLLTEGEIFNLLKVNAYSLLCDCSCRDTKQITGRGKKKKNQGE